MRLRASGGKDWTANDRDVGIRSGDRRCPSVLEGNEDQPCWDYRTTPTLLANAEHQPHRSGGQRRHSRLVRQASGDTRSAAYRPARTGRLDPSVKSIPLSFNAMTSNVRISISSRSSASAALMMLSRRSSAIIVFIRRAPPGLAEGSPIVSMSAAYPLPRCR